MCQFKGQDYLVGVLSCSTGVKEPITICNMLTQRKRATTDFVSVPRYRDWIEKTSISLTEVKFEYHKFTTLIYMYENIYFIAYRLLISHIFSGNLWKTV